MSPPILRPNWSNPLARHRTTWLTLDFEANAVKPPMSMRVWPPAEPWRLRVVRARQLHGLSTWLAIVLADLVDAVFIAMYFCSFVHHVTTHNSVRPPRVPRSRSTLIHPSPSWSLSMSLLLHQTYSCLSFTTVLQHEFFAWPSPCPVDRHVAFYTCTSRAKIYIKSIRCCQSLIIQEWPRHWSSRVEYTGHELVWEGEASSDLEGGIDCSSCCSVSCRSQSTTWGQWWSSWSPGASSA